MNPESIENEIEQKYLKFIEEIDEQFKKDLQSYENSLIADQSVLSKPTKGPSLNPSDPEQELSNWRRRFSRNDIAALREREAALEGVPEKIEFEEFFTAQAKTNSLVCENRNFVLALIEPILYIKPHKSGCIERFDLSIYLKPREGKLDVERILLSNFCENDYFILLTRNMKLLQFRVVYTVGKIDIKKCPITLAQQIKSRNFVWKRNVLYFQAEKEIHQMVFRSDPDSALDESFIDQYVFSRVLSLSESFSGFDVSKVYDLFYVLSKERIFVYSTLNYPVHVFKPSLADGEKIACLRSFRSFLPAKSEPSEGDKELARQNDLIVCLTSRRRVLVYDIGQMSSGSENVFKVDELDLCSLFKLENVENDFSEFQLAPDSSFILIRSNALKALFFLKINQKYLACEAVAQLCLNPGAKPQSSERSVLPKPFYPSNESGEQSELGLRKSGEPARRMYQPFFEFCSCQLLPENAISVVSSFTYSKNEWPLTNSVLVSAKNPFGEVEAILVNILDSKFWLSTYSLTVGYLDHFQSMKETPKAPAESEKRGAQEASGQKTEKLVPLQFSNSPRKEQQSQTQNKKEFPPEMPKMIKLLCEKSKEKNSSECKEKEQIALDKNTESNQQDEIRTKTEQNCLLEPQTDFQIQEEKKSQQKNEPLDSLEDSRFHEKRQSEAIPPFDESQNNQNHSMHRTSDFAHLPPLHEKPEKASVFETKDQLESPRKDQKTSSEIKEDAPQLFADNKKTIDLANKIGAEQDFGNGEPANSNLTPFPAILNPSKEILQQDKNLSDKPNNVNRSVLNPVAIAAEKKELADNQNQTAAENEREQDKDKDKARRRDTKLRKKKDEAFAQQLSTLLMTFHDKINTAVQQFAEEAKRSLSSDIQNIVISSLKDSQRNFALDVMAEMERTVYGHVDKYLKRLSEKHIAVSEKLLLKCFEKAEASAFSNEQMLKQFDNAFESHAELVAQINDFVSAAAKVITTSLSKDAKVSVESSDVKSMQEMIAKISVNQKGLASKLASLNQRICGLETSRVSLSDLPPRNAQTLPERFGPTGLNSFGQQSSDLQGHFKQQAPQISSFVPNIQQTMPQPQLGHPIDSRMLGPGNLPIQALLPAQHNYLPPQFIAQQAQSPFEYSTGQAYVLPRNTPQAMAYANYLNLLHRQDQGVSSLQGQSIYLQPQLPK